jgi:hypothetical protein
MADLKISQLSDGGNAQAADEFVVARSGANFRIDGASVAAAATSVGTLTSLTVSGDLTVDTSTLKVDSANNRVGIGTASPGQKFVVYESLTNTNAYAVIENNRARNAAVLTKTTNGGFYTGTSIGTDTLCWQVYDEANGERMRLDASGNLGLGVTPSAWATYTALQIKNGSIANYSPTQDMRISSNAYYTSGVWKRIAAAYATQYLQDGSTGTHAWFNAGTSTADSTITFTQAMTLDASGNLGLGTASPSISATATGIDIYDATDVQLRLHTGVSGTGLSDGFILSMADDNTVYLYGYENAPMIFATNNNERARITSGGYFKASNNGTYRGATGSYNEINNTQGGNPILSLRGSSAIDPNGLDIQFSAVSNDNNTQYFLTCLDSTTTRCYIWSDGDLANHDGVYGTISDERLKQDIVDAGSQWDDIKAIRFRKYRMKTDVAADPNAPAMLGVVAQELEQTSPGLVDEHPEYETRDVPVLDEDGNETGEVTTEKVQVGTTKTVKSSILLMKAAVALQEAMARIEALEARLEALEA